MIEHALHSILSNDTGVTALVSDRIYPLLPQNTVYPCVSYSASEGGADSSFDGQGTFERVSIEVDAWGETYQQMLDIAGALKSALKNYIGTVEGITIDQITIDSAVSVYEDQVEKYRKTLIATLYRR